LGQRFVKSEKREDNIMKTKGSIFISCLAAGALIASPALGKPEKKSGDASTSKPKRMAPHTTQVTPSYRYYAAPRYTGTRSYASRQYSGARYYGATPYYGGKAYYRGTGYYYSGGSAYPYYSYYSGWPSNWGYGTSWGYYPYSGWGGYPYSYNNNNYYSYYTPTYGYDASLVAAVQQRLGQLGYYHGGVDGAIGPRTRSAMAAFESTHGLTVDGSISRPLLNRLELA
jgi:Putative peptidoglycan binding domain